MPIRTGERVAAREDRDLSFFRLSKGQKLGELCVAMSVVAQKNPGIELPTNPRSGAVIPRVLLAKRKEIRSNPGLRNRAPTLKRDTERYFHGTTSQLNTSRIVVADALDIHTNKQGEHFLTLIFQQDHANELGEERADLWNAFEDLQRNQPGGSDLDWKPYDPNMRLVYAANTVAPRTVLLVAQYISSHLPLPVSLGPVFEPNDG